MVYQVGVCMYCMDSKYSAKYCLCHAWLTSDVVFSFLFFSFGTGSISTVSVFSGSHPPLEFYFLRIFLHNNNNNNIYALKYFKKTHWIFTFYIDNRMISPYTLIVLYLRLVGSSHNRMSKCCERFYVML